MLIISLALGCTLGAAWIICQSRALPTADYSQQPAYWPIRFSLPEHIKWIAGPTISPLLDLNAGDTGAITFLGIAPGRGRYGLSVSYRVADSAASEDDSPLNVLSPGMTALDEIDIGPLKGRLYLKETTRPAVLLARAWSDDGLMLEVEISSLYSAAHAELVLRDVCESIQYQDWWYPRPELWPLDDADENREVTS